MAFVARRPRNADVELRVHGRRLRVPGTATRVVPAAPPASRQHGPPRLFRVQRWFGHPVVRADVHDVQLREVPRKVFERHPERKRYQQIRPRTNVFKYITGGTRSKFT